jgi:nitrogen regulatory protein PII
MKKIEAIVAYRLLHEIAESLTEEFDISGMTVEEVKRTGHTGEDKKDYFPAVRITVYCEDDAVEAITQKVIDISKSTDLMEERETPFNEMIFVSDAPAGKTIRQGMITGDGEEAQTWLKRATGNFHVREQRTIIDR